MGCCCSKQSQDAGTRPLAQYRSGEARVSSKSLVEPARVNNLTATKHPSLPHVILSWEAPSNLPELGEVDKYCIKITASHEGLGGEPEPPLEVEVEGGTTTRELTDQDGLKPLLGYRLDVQAIRHHKKGTWATVECFVDWVCRLPECSMSRQKLTSGDIYSFCSVGHKIQYDEGYCLHPDCSNPIAEAPRSLSMQSKSRTASESSAPPLVREEDHFCSSDHFQDVRSRKNSYYNKVFFIQVDSGSQEFQDIEGTLQKHWSSKDIKCPSLKLILAVVNPNQDANFMKYKQIYDVKDKNIASYFFGTNIGCDLYNDQTPCNGAMRNFSNCSVCHLASQGFGKLIYPDSPSFLLHKNPVDAHNKVQPDSEMYTYSLLLCDVACVNVKKAKNDADAGERPERVDAVVVQQTDELKVFNADIVCLRYILFYIT